MSQTILGSPGRGSYQTYQAPKDQSFRLETISFNVFARIDAGQRFLAVGIGNVADGITTNAYSLGTGDQNSLIAANFGIGYVANVDGTGTGWAVNAPLPDLVIDGGAIVWVGSFRQGGAAFASDQIGQVYLQGELFANSSAATEGAKLPIFFMPGAGG